MKFCGLPPDAATPDNVRNSIREWAENNQKWLFVYDNAEEYGLLRGYLPRNHVGQGNTLITSRNEFWSDLGIVPQKIGLFTEEEAVAFLRRRTLGKPRDGAGPLAKELGYLPLALEHAGAYIAENDLSFSDYQKLYREYSFRLLRESETSERTAVDVTWQISIDKIKSESARQFLYLCSYYAPDKILVDSLIKNNVRLPEPLKKDAADPLALNRAVHELRRYSLINVSEADKNEIGVHRLLQEAIKSGLAPGNEYVRSCAENLTELIYDKYYSTAEARERFGALAPHGVSVCENLRRQGAVAEDFHRLFFNLAYGFNETAKYPDAVFFYNIALEIREKVLGKDHPDTATTYNNMAMVYKVQGDYGRALEFYGKALTISEKVLGKDHPDTATTYNNMAVVYEAQGYYDKALKFHGKVLEIREKVLEEDHPDTATTYNNMAVVYENKGDYDRALEFYGKAFAIYEKVLGKDHPDTATTYNNMAGIYYAQGDYGRALEFFGKALAIREKVLGKDHPYTATTYNDMALVYEAQGDYGRALEFFGKAFAIYEKVLGKDHPDTATTYNNMAVVYKAQGYYDRALEFYGKALAIREKVLGKDHRDTATTYNNMALVYYAQGDYDRVLEFYGKALEIREKVLGKDHPDNARTYNNMAGVFYAQGEYDSALEFYGKALAILKKKLGDHHPNTISASNNMLICEQSAKNRLIGS
ncbi:MAG: tetratricopeptide repeat protein [Firmicutes bacterium]|nr:tetratricopeptide repeat protein [Bacillota bacterium]